MQLKLDPQISQVRKINHEKYLQQRKENLINNKKTLWERLTDYDQIVEKFKQEFAEVSSSAYSNNHIVRTKEILESIISAATEIEGLESLYLTSLKKADSYLVDLLANHTGMNSTSCFDQYVVPLVDLIWNIKFTLELDLHPLPISFEEKFSRLTKKEVPSIPNEIKLKILWHAIGACQSVEEILQTVIGFAGGSRDNWAIVVASQTSILAIIQSKITEFHQVNKTNEAKLLKFYKKACEAKAPLFFLLTAKMLMRINKNKVSLDHPAGARWIKGIEILFKNGITSINSNCISLGEDFWNNLKKNNLLQIFNDIPPVLWLEQISNITSVFPNRIKLFNHALALYPDFRKFILEFYAEDNSCNKGCYSDSLTLSNLLYYNNYLKDFSFTTKNPPHFIALQMLIKPNNCNLIKKSKTDIQEHFDKSRELITLMIKDNIEIDVEEILKLEDKLRDSIIADNRSYCLSKIENDLNFIQLKCILGHSHPIFDSLNSSRDSEIFNQLSIASLRDFFHKYKRTGRYALLELISTLNPDIYSKLRLALKEDRVCLPLTNKLSSLLIYLMEDILKRTNLTFFFLGGLPKPLLKDIAKEISPETCFKLINNLSSSTFFEKINYTNSGYNSDFSLSRDMPECILKAYIYRESMEAPASIQRKNIEEPLEESAPSSASQWFPFFKTRNSSSWQERIEAANALMDVILTQNMQTLEINLKIMETVNNCPTLRRIYESIKTSLNNLDNSSHSNSLPHLS